MSSIIPHDGFDSTSDSDDDYAFDPDQVEQHYHHDDNDVHSNDPPDENDEFPTPDEWPILLGWSVLRDTEVAGSLRRETTHEKQPSAYGTGIFLPLPLLSHLVISKGNWKNYGLSSVCLLSNMKSPMKMLTQISPHPR